MGEFSEEENGISCSYDSLRVKRGVLVGIGVFDAMVEGGVVFIRGCADGVVRITDGWLLLIEWMRIADPHVVEAVLVEISSR